MTAVSPLKVDLQVEELKTGAAASEYTMQKVGSSVNFWNTFYEGSKHWKVNGFLGSLSLPYTELDGPFFCWSDMEIWAIGFSISVAGTSGDLEFDIIRYPADGSPSSTIFSTRPKINYTAGSGAWYVEDLNQSLVHHTQAGITAPILSTINLTAGDKLVCNLVGKQSGNDTKNATLSIAIRPR